MYEDPDEIQNWLASSEESRAEVNLRMAEVCRDFQREAAYRLEQIRIHEERLFAHRQNLTIFGRYDIVKFGIPTTVIFRPRYWRITRLYNDLFEPKRSDLLFWLYNRFEITNLDINPGYRAQLEADARNFLIYQANEGL